jgi:rod shape determining protein RodA
MLKLFRQFDWSIFITAIVLIFVGFMAILSTTWQEGQMMKFIDKQIIAVVLGLLLLFLLASLNYKIFGNWAYSFYIIICLLLVFVLLFGREIRGTRGWFDFGFFQFQPSEFAKIALLIILAKYFSSISGKPSHFQYVIVSGILTLIPTILVLFQPDLGSALILVFMWLCMLLLSGIKKHHILALVTFGIIIFWVGWHFILITYQKERILTFVNPGRDPLGSGYHLIQSKIAIGSGEIFGRGLGRGPQSQLQFLPDKHTDFIFAVIAEELGFLGAGLLLALLLFLIWRIIVLAKQIHDEFAMMLVLGTLLFFLIQIFINIGMNLGILPVAGVPLPFVSYGGSSMIASLIVLGILQGVAVFSKTKS